MYEYREPPQKNGNARTIDIHDIANAVQSGVRKSLRTRSLEITADEFADLVHDGLISYLEKKGEPGPGDDPISAWCYAYQCGKSAALMWMRREAREREAAATYAEVQRLGGVGEITPETKQRLFQAFLKSRKKRGRRGLMAAARDVAIFTMAADRASDAEIAEAMGMSQNSVKTTRKRARDRLCSYFQSHSHH